MLIAERAGAGFTLHRSETVAHSAGLQPTSVLQSSVFDMDKEYDTALGRCSWDGDPSGWTDFVRRVRLLYEKTTRKKRRQLGPSLVSQLRDRAWTITQDINHQRLTRRDGCVYLLEFLRERLGRSPIPDIGIRLEELMIRLRRAPGTPMSSWATQVRQTYKRVQVALHRARAEQQTGKGVELPSPAADPPVRAPSGHSSPSSASRRDRGSPTRRGSEATQEEPQAEDADDEVHPRDQLDEELLDPGAQAQSSWKKRRPRKYDDDDDDSDDSAAMLADLEVWDRYEEGLQEVLPPEVLGWLLLRRANLPTSARLSIQAAAGNSLMFTDIERAMRSMEDELMVHDDSRKQQPPRRRSFWIEDDGEWSLLLTSEDDLQDVLAASEVHYVGPRLPQDVYFQYDDDPFASQYDTGYWHQDDDGAYSFWELADDGEFYTQDPSGLYWAWQDWTGYGGVPSSPGPDPSKDSEDAFAVQDPKSRTFSQARQAVRAKQQSRGFYPFNPGIKGKGRPKGKGKGKGKGKNPFPRPSPSPVMAATSEIFAQPGDPSFSGCFVCGSKEHSWRSCPKRSSSGKGSGKNQGSRSYYTESIFMIQPENEGFEKEGIVPEVLEEKLLQSDPGDCMSSCSSSTCGCHGSRTEDPRLLDFRWVSSGCCKELEEFPGPDVSPGRPTFAVTSYPTEEAFASGNSDSHPRGHAVIDSGATETVGSLPAIEDLMAVRFELSGAADEFRISSVPPRRFRFGNGAVGFSLSHILIPQDLGPNRVDLGVYSLDVERNLWQWRQSSSDRLWCSLQIDGFYMRFGTEVFHYLLMVDEASGFCIIEEVLRHSEKEMKHVTTAQVIKILETRWCQIFGFPEMLKLDPEGAFRGYDLGEYCASRGIYLDVVPAEYHESISEVERSIGTIRRKIETFIRAEQYQPSRAAAQMVSAHNTLARTAGFSPAQWAFGRDVSITGHSRERAGEACAQSAMTDPSHGMHEALELRTRAEKAFLEYRAKDLTSRAMNAKTRPSKKFLPGDVIFYQRYQTPQDSPANLVVDKPRVNIARFYGPARVLATETKSDLVDGVRKPSALIWAICNGRLKKFHQSQVRHASETERLVAEGATGMAFPWTFSTLADLLDRGSYDDETIIRSRTRGRSQTPARSRSLPPVVRRRSDGRELPEPVVPQAEPVPQPPELDQEEELVKVLPDRGQKRPEPSDQEDEEMEMIPAPDVPPSASSSSLNMARYLNDPNYFSSEFIVLNEAENDQVFHVEDNGATREEAGSYSFAITLDAPASESEWKAIVKNPKKFVAKSVQKGVEVSYAKLNSTQRAAMDNAMKVEIDNWLRTVAVKAAGKFVPQRELLKMRWVLTFKSASAENEDDGSGKPSQRAERVKPKARIVILGYSDPNLLDATTASPAMTRLSRQLLLNMASVKRWDILCGDVKSAFLQARSPQAERCVFATPVPELARALHLSEGQSVQLLRSVYGLVSAPREWYEDVNKTLLALSAERLVTDSCVWRIRDPKTNLIVGLVSSHVDDFLMAGNNNSEVWCAFLDSFKKSYEWSPWEYGHFKH
eukprot:s1939_g17.t1